jgi:hypothetical protein
MMFYMGLKLGLTLTVEHRLKRVLGRIFGPKREEVVGGCRILHNEELNNLYASSYSTRVIT